MLFRIKRDIIAATYIRSKSGWGYTGERHQLKNGDIVLYLKPIDNECYNEDYGMFFHINKVVLVENRWIEGV